MRLRKRVLFGLAGVLAVLVLAVAWWLASPLFISMTVQEDFPLPASAEIPPQVTRAEAQQLMNTMAKLDQELSEAMPAGPAAPAKLKSGAFHDADSFHKGSGQATIYRLANGAHVLRLEDFKVTNGPDLRVILSPHPDPTTPAEVKMVGYAEVGKLKGNVGNQNYDMPADVDLARQRSVVIYCKPFSVIFSVAPLRESS